MKAILLVLLFAGLVVQNKGMKEQDDADDIELNKKAHQEATGESRTPSKIRYSYNRSSIHIGKLQTKIEEFPPSKAKDRAKKLFRKLNINWDGQTLVERRRRSRAVRAVVNNLEAIRNSTQVDRTPSYIALLDLMEMLGHWTTRNGISGKAAMFTTSCMALFGEVGILSTGLMVLISADIRVTINAFPPRSPMITFGDSDITAGSYHRFKWALNNLGVKGPLKISSNLIAFKLKPSMSTFISTTGSVIDKLYDNIETMITNNNATDGKRFLAYVELYVKLETVRQMFLYHALSLVSTRDRASRRFIKEILNKIDEIDQKSKFCAEPVYNHHNESKFMAYYDDEENKVLSAYMEKRFKWPIRRHYPYWLFPGLSCIGMYDGYLRKTYSYWKFSNSHAIDHPYFSSHGAKPCEWRVVSHGEKLYSIVNKNGCPNGPWCNAFLSIDKPLNSDRSIVSIKHNEPVLWEFRRTPMGGYFTIWPKRFCDKRLIGCALRYRYLNPKKQTRMIGEIECLPPNSGIQVTRWSIYSAHLSDMVTESGSAATNQSSALENQVDNSASGEKDDGVNNFSDENENEILEKSKQETNEPDSNQDYTENDIED